jgi:hypothetical protein
VGLVPSFSAGAGYDCGGDRGDFVEGKRISQYLRVMLRCGTTLR